MRLKQHYLSTYSSLTSQILSAGEESLTKVTNSYQTELNSVPNLYSFHRVYVLCDLHLYRLYDDYTMKKKAPIDIGDILGISVSNGADQAIVIHCAVSILPFTAFSFPVSLCFSH